VIGALRKYFEKKIGIVWAIATAILFLLAFGGFDLIFKAIYVESKFQNSALVWFQGLVQNELAKDLARPYQSTFFMFLLAFLIVVVIGILIWRFTSAKKDEKQRRL
jgi:hypothetical protein